MIKVSGISAFTRNLEKKKTIPEKMIREKVKRIVYYAHQNILERTPVWSGRAIRNWVWTMDAPNGTEFEPIENGPTGQTNEMPLGTEPRRAANAAASTATLEALKFTNPFRQYWLSNNANDIIQLEYGLLPDPERSRQPGGMYRVTLQELIMRLQSGAF